MKLLRLCAGTQKCQILLFGLGLIGSAIDRSLCLRFHGKGEIRPYDWQDADLRCVQRGAIREALESDGGGGRIILVWAGGRSGFGSTVEDMEGETLLVNELVTFACRIKERFRDSAVEFHLLSSAGGLFEGQTHCSASSRPRPMRPYGEGKMAQERILFRARELDGRHIYRPSSVYGVTGSRRVGLVAALIGNGLTGATTHIFGNPGTLRDYVLADDVGRFVAGRIAIAEHGPVRVHLLATGRPAAVHEIIELTRRCTDAPLRLRFDPHPTNTRNMSFLTSALPVGWTSTSLATGVAHAAILIRSQLR